MLFLILRRLGEAAFYAAFDAAAITTLLCHGQYEEASQRQLAASCTA
jgi:hypothetical protein